MVSELAFATQATTSQTKAVSKDLLALQTALGKLMAHANAMPD